jgi:aspartyl-tRNA(Asn)/glutamyl-tRNA(Gln) amidotransferase subunit B
MKTMGLEQIDNTKELEAVVQKVITENPDQAADYRAGKTALIKFFIGKVMAETDGRANPKIIKEILEKFLA